MPNGTHAYSIAHIFAKTMDNVETSQIKRGDKGQSKEKVDKDKVKT